MLENVRPITFGQSPEDALKHALTLTLKIVVTFSSPFGIPSSVHWTLRVNGKALPSIVKPAKIVLLISELPQVNVMLKHLKILVLFYQ